MQLKHSVFSVWTVAQPVVVEMEMHSVGNLATLQTPLATFSPFKKVAEPYLVWELPVLPCEVLHFQCVHTHLSRLYSARGREEQRFNSVKTQILCCFFLILHASTAEITAQLMSLSCVYLISSDDGSIIRIFCAD